MLQEDKKALERLNKSKEAALIEAEKILKSAMERALIVEEVQNQNFELKRQIEICQVLSSTLAFEDIVVRSYIAKPFISMILQEENRILDKTNRQKVAEVEKLSKTIHELEEAILAGGGTANAVRDYQRQMSELNVRYQTHFLINSSVVSYCFSSWRGSNLCYMSKVLGFQMVRN